MQRAGRPRIGFLPLCPLLSVSLSRSRGRTMTVIWWPRLPARSAATRSARNAGRSSSLILVRRQAARHRDDRPEQARAAAAVGRSERFGRDGANRAERVEIAAEYWEADLPFEAKSRASAYVMVECGSYTEQTIMKTSSYYRSGRKSVSKTSVVMRFVIEIYHNILLS